MPGEQTLLSPAVMGAAAGELIRKLLQVIQRRAATWWMQ